TAQAVTAVNTAFSHTMRTGQVLGDRITAFVAGDDKRAKERILRMARDIGFDAVDAGGLQSARWIEALGLFHIHLGYGQKMGPDTGTKLIPQGGVRSTNGRSWSSSPVESEGIANAGSGVR